MGDSLRLEASPYFHRDGAGNSNDWGSEKAQELERPSKFLSLIAIQLYFMVFYSPSVENAFRCGALDAGGFRVELDLHLILLSIV